MDADRPELVAFRREWQEDLVRQRIGNDSGQREWSEVSTATLQAMSSAGSVEPAQVVMPDLSHPQTSETYLLADDRMDIESEDVETSSDAGLSETLFIVATDFGTTFSSVSFCKIFQGRLETPQTIMNYLDDPMIHTKPNSEVPTESWYPCETTLNNETDQEMAAIDEADVSDDFDENDDDINELFRYLQGDNQSNERHNGLAEVNYNLDNQRDQQHIGTEQYIPSFPWGYQTQALMRSGNVERSNFKCLSRFKLMLDESKDTEEVRSKLRPILNQLKWTKTIKKDEDVITHYLIQLFLHTKKQLTLHHSFSGSCAVKHVLCVPNAWTPKACRTMQQAMEIAIRKSELGTLENLFIVSEPEAAATFVLHENNNIPIVPGETFVILDAGGGTVDATTYTVHSTYPLRLLREEVEPTSDLCGSSYLNQEYRKGFSDRIKDENYLEAAGQTLENITDEAVVDFENRLKRLAHYDDKTRSKKKREIAGWSVKIPGLRADPWKRFKENRMIVEHVDIAKVFDPILGKISTLMIKQITEAMKSGFQKIQKVILVGGFAGSPLLRAHLQRKLNIISSSFDLQINLFVPNSSIETAVSLGAVLRTLEKGDGPERISKSSYGFLRTEPHEPEIWDAHKEQRPTTDKLDGKKYIRNTIEWLVKVQDIIPSRKEFPIEVIHTFPVGARSFKCEDYLYVSDKSTESHYRIKHPNNKGAEIAGTIIADMTFLKTEGFIQPIVPQAGEGGKPHYRVEFELVMIIDGRNLRYEARYPAGGAVQDRGRISIAAAFEPGTK